MNYFAASSEELDIVKIQISKTRDFTLRSLVRSASENPCSPIDAAHSLRAFVYSRLMQLP
jgi:hypothetical protein